MTNYALLQSILEEAGFSHPVFGEIPSGVVDGNNKIFTVCSKPLTDTDYSDVVDESDVRVYVNGVPLENSDIDDIDVQFGIITLKVAPTANAIVTVDYRYSAVSMQFADEVRQEAQGWINMKMRKYDVVPYGPAYEDVPAIIRNICRLWAASSLLLRDYGFNNDTELTSKDGAEKLKAVKTLITELQEDGGAVSNGGAVSEEAQAVESISDGNLFGAFERGERPDSDGERW